MERKIRYVATAARWFDKVNGNTYNSVKAVCCSSGASLVCQFQYRYGNHSQQTAIATMIVYYSIVASLVCQFHYRYGDHYHQTTLAAMRAARWLPAKYSTSNSLSSYEREHGYPIRWTVTDGLKRDCVAIAKADTPQPQPKG